jgi:hypothetical protein
MPRLNLSALEAILDPAELALAKRCIASRGANKGCLRASKPPVSSDDPESGKAAYLWRMIAFTASPKRQHQCLPICADFDLPGSYEGRRFLARELDALADKVLETIPKSQHHGTHSWGKAFGYW